MRKWHVPLSSSSREERCPRRWPGVVCSYAWEPLLAERVGKWLWLKSQASRRLIPVPSAGWPQPSLGLYLPIYKWMVLGLMGGWHVVMICKCQVLLRVSIQNFSTRLHQTVHIPAPKSAPASRDSRSSFERSWGSHLPTVQGCKWDDCQGQY